MIVIEFDNFKSFALENNKRIYYFKVDNIIELYYIIDGVFVKSFVDANKVVDKEVFFGDKLFIGATKLLLNVNESGDNISPAKREEETSIIEVVAPAESENEDIQADGVD